MAVDAASRFSCYSHSDAFQVTVYICSQFVYSVHCCKEGEVCVSLESLAQCIAY